MWLECICVVVGVVVRRYIDFLIILLIPTPLLLALFCSSSSIPTSLIIFKMFFVLVIKYIAIIILYIIYIYIYMYTCTRQMHYINGASLKECCAVRLKKSCEDILNPDISIAQNVR